MKIKQERAPSRVRTSDFVDLTLPAIRGGSEIVNLDSPVEEEEHVLADGPDPDMTGAGGTTKYQIQQYIK